MEVYERPFFGFGLRLAPLSPATFIPFDFGLRLTVDFCLAIIAPYDAYEVLILPPSNVSDPPTVVNRTVVSSALNDFEDVPLYIMPE